MTQCILGMTAGFIKSICALFGFAVVLQVFDTPVRSEIAKLLPITFKTVAKTC